MSVLQNEPAFRLGSFFGVLLVMGLWERIAPRRKRALTRRQRWKTNLGLVAADTLFLRILLPLTAIHFASGVYESGTGLLRGLHLAFGLEVVITVVLLDFIIYLQHVMFHAVPVLWRLHLVHHADVEIDVTTGVRFHPVEILISMAIKFGAIYVLGASPLSVLLFEVILNGCAMFNHSNVKLPALADGIIRTTLVTPDMHRVHHSVEPHETNSNFGFSLSIWDRLCGTYVPQPEMGHIGMEIGLKEFRGAQTARLLWALSVPFRRAENHYSVGRR